MNAVRKNIKWLIVWWAWIPVVLLIWGVAINFGWEGTLARQGFNQFMLAHVWSNSVLGWSWVAINLIGSIIIMAVSRDEYEQDEWGYKRHGTHRVYFRDPSVWEIVVAVLLLVASLLQLTRVYWDNDKDFARYYNRNTIFYVPDTKNVPLSLKLLTKGGRLGDGQRCDMVGSGDVGSCIKQGQLSLAGWEPRVGSLDGATFAIRNASADVQNVTLNKDTLVYLNEWRGQPARWSGVLDGKGKQVHLGGVAEWSGQGKIEQCLFTNRYGLDRAFAGKRSNNLRNLIAEQFPNLRFHMYDVWGYCQGDGKVKEPVVVVPMLRQVHFKDRTVDTAGGFVLVQGRNGHTKLTYHSSAEPGEYPGPMYSATLTARQRSETAWAAGRQNQDDNGFGFEPTTANTQMGNVSEFLLRNKRTGRLEWVTPLTLRKSKSQTFVAYAVTPADTVTAGKLNQLSVYVMADDDSRRINIAKLETDANNFFVNNAGTFKSNGGKLVEFTPIDGTLWRAFGEINGNVVFRLDISADDKVQTRLVSLDPRTGQVESSTGTACGKPLSQLEPNQLTKCLKQFATELDERQSQTQSPDN